MAEPANTYVNNSGLEYAKLAADKKFGKLKV